MMRLKPWHCFALLSLITLLAYYPSLFAGFNSVDDLNMVNGLDERGPINLVQLFFPSGAYYYRPLTILTYLLDRDLWGSIASFMHLENILLHLLNTLLVFAVTRRLTPLWKTSGLWPAFFAGLVFALHPLTVESVSWVSGRTDLIMTLFLLGALWLTLAGLHKQRWWLFGGAAIALFIAPLAKEVAVFVLPGLVWLIVVYPGDGHWFQRLRQRWWPLLAVNAGTLGYLLWRSMIIRHDSGISTALKGVTGGAEGLDFFVLLDKLRVALKVYGFYFKKLFVPWPLNFAIVEISDWYLLAGIVLVVLLLYLIWRADVPGAFGLMAFYVLSPALLVVFGKMTWTPLAERYLYTSVAFFAPVTAWWIARSVSTQRSLSVAPLILLGVFFTTTFHRSWVWQDNLRLYQDTVAKSPAFDAAKSELASAFMVRGQMEDAKKILASMQAEKTAGGYINDELNLASVLLQEGDTDGARATLLAAVGKNPKKRYALLQLLIKVNNDRLGKISDQALRVEILSENIGWLTEQQQLRPNPFTLYRIGKQYLMLGDKESALKFFKDAYAKAPADAHYVGAAAKFIEKLSQ